VRAQLAHPTQPVQISSQFTPLDGIKMEFRLEVGLWIEMFRGDSEELGEIGAQKRFDQ
jgi:hypothetical protein